MIPADSVAAFADAVGIGLADGVAEENLNTAELAETGTPDLHWDECPSLIHPYQHRDYFRLYQH